MSLRTKISAQAAEDARTVERVRARLEGYLQEGGPGSAVNVAHVLDLLNPRGLWRFDPVSRGKTAQNDVKPQPEAGQDPSSYGGDPITGCLPMNPGA